MTQRTLESYISMVKRNPNMKYIVDECKDSLEKWQKNHQKYLLFKRRESGEEKRRLDKMEAEWLANDSEEEKKKYKGEPIIGYYKEVI